MTTMYALLFIVLSIQGHQKCCVNAIETSDLYPYGINAADNKLTPAHQSTQEDDISSNEITLNTNIKFYSNEYTAIYVSIIVLLFYWFIVFTYKSSSF